MVDPNRLKDFLTRTASALQKSMDAGDAEGAQKYGAMLDRASSLGEKIAQQPQAMPQAGQAGPSGPQGAPQEAPEPVIPWGVKPAAMPQDAPEAKADAAQGPWVPTFPSPAKNPLLTMPGGQDTPQVSKGPTIGPSAMPGAKPPVKDWADFSIDLGEGKPMDPIHPPTEWGKAFGVTFPPVPKGGRPATGKENLEMPAAEKSKLVFEDPNELNRDSQEQKVQQPEAELLDAAIAEPADDIEAEALRRIQREVAAKPSALEYIMLFLLIGAPRTVSKMMADEDRYSAGVRDVWKSLRAERAQAKSQKFSQGMREREVAATEKRADASAKLSTSRAESGEEAEVMKSARAIINNVAIPENSPQKRWAYQMVGAPGTQLPK